jgi:hypothetical protein
MQNSNVKVPTPTAGSHIEEEWCSYEDEGQKTGRGSLCNQPEKLFAREDINIRVNRTARYLGRISGSRAGGMEVVDVFVFHGT